MHHNCMNDRAKHLHVCYLILFPVVLFHLILFQFQSCLHVLVIVTLHTHYINTECYVQHSSPMLHQLRNGGTCFLLLLLLLPLTMIPSKTLKLSHFNRAFTDFIEDYTQTPATLKKCPSCFVDDNC